MRVNNRSQANQIFISIVAIFVFAMILFFGYRGISKLIKGAEDVQAVQFKANLEKEFERIRNAGFGSRFVYGQANQFKSIPGLLQVCFFDSVGASCDGNSNGNGYGPNTPVICNAFDDRDKTGQNVFIDGDIRISGDIKVGNVQINKDAADGIKEDNVLCIKPTGNLLCFSLENKGQNVFVDTLADCGNKAVN